MMLRQIFAQSGGRGSDAITNMLGVIAIAAFLSVVIYIAVVQAREAARRQAAAKLRRKSQGDEARQPKSLLEFDDGYSAALQRFVADLEAFYGGTVETASRKLEELARLSRTAFERIALSYGANAVLADGESSASRMALFESVCERQWGYFRGEMGFISYHEANDHLRPILDSARLLDAHVTRKLDDDAEISTEMLRSQEIVSLARAVLKDRVTPLQESMMEAIGPFRDYYERHVNEWINDRLFRIVAKMKERGDKGVSIANTDLADRFNTLKSRLEMVARLSERIAQNTQKIDEESIALSQFVYVGTVLRILSEVSEWFPGIASGNDALGEGESETSAAAIAPDRSR